VIGGLGPPARATINCLGVRPNDMVLVVCNPPQRPIAEALAEAARRLTNKVRVMEFASLTRHGEEPPALVLDALGSASVLLAVTEFSLSHTVARIEATRHGVRIASMPELDESTFAETLPVDYSRLADAARAVADSLTQAQECRVMTPGGTDLTLSLAHRSAIADDGDLRQPGAFGNLPAGEAYIAPVAGSGNGIVIVDGSLAGYGVPRSPMRLIIENGRLAGVEGEAAEWLLESLDAGGEDGRELAELGIGVNPNAHLSGSTVVDEKALGTAHVAFGDNTGFGGTNEASVHIDVTMRAPMIELDGHPLAIPVR
jgi:leucyl aminopeptidase (aminopeptidase T)